MLISHKSTSSNQHFLLKSASSNGLFTGFMTECPPEVYNVQWITKSCYFYFKNSFVFRHFSFFGEGVVGVFITIALCQAFILLCFWHSLYFHSFAVLPIYLDQGQPTFPAKGQTVNTLDFVSHTVTVGITQSCRCGEKAIIEWIEWSWMYLSKTLCNGRECKPDLVCLPMPELNHYPFPNSFFKIYSFFQIST